MPQVEELAWCFETIRALRRPSMSWPESVPLVARNFCSAVRAAGFVAADFPPRPELLHRGAHGGRDDAVETRAQEKLLGQGTSGAGEAFGSGDDRMSRRSPPSPAESDARRPGSQSPARTDRRRCCNATSSHADIFDMRQLMLRAVRVAAAGRVVFRESHHHPSINLREQLASSSTADLRRPWPSRGARRRRPSWRRG